MDTATRVQILSETGCISSYGKIVGQTRFFSLGEAISLGEKNSEFKPVKRCLKIDPVSYPARAEGLVNMNKATSLKEKEIWFRTRLVPKGRYRLLHSWHFYLWNTLVNTKYQSAAISPELWFSPQHFIYLQWNRCLMVFVRFYPIYRVFQAFCKTIPRSNQQFLLLPGEVHMQISGLIICSHLHFKCLVTRRRSK